MYLFSYSFSIQQNDKSNQCHQMDLHNFGSNRRVSFDHRHKNIHIYEKSYIFFTNIIIYIPRSVAGGYFHFKNQNGDGKIEVKEYDKNQSNGNGVSDGTGNENGGMYDKY